MKLLAIDPGTKMGWCVTDGKVYDAGVWDFTPRRFDGGGMVYLRFRETLGSVLEMGIQRVAYEEVRSHLGVDAAHRYGGLVAVLSEECERRSIPYESVPVGTIKKAATGTGNASKPAMIAAAKELWPHMVIVDDNQADAMHLAHYVAAQMNGRR